MENKFKTIHLGLNEKFKKNIELAFDSNDVKIEEIEVKTKAIYALGELLGRKIPTNSVQIELLKFFPEIFKDLTLSTHFLCCSVNNASKIILRRVLEIGISVIYLWDQPHKYLKWVKFDEHSADLSFKEMLEHLNDSGYIDFINIENKTSIVQLLDKEVTNAIYRQLSNIIHGKEITFESLTANSFELDTTELKNNIDLIINVQDILLDIYILRFYKVRELFFKEYTPITKYKNG